MGTTERAASRWWLVPIVALLALLSLPAAAPAQSEPDPVSLVNPFIGTGGNGHTFPGADVPFGMVQFSPVSVNGGPAGYSYEDTRLSGFALTRLSGAGCTNYGDVPVMPVAGPPRHSPVTAPWDFTSGYSHADETAGPGYYAVRLASGISATLGATTRTGLGAFTYPVRDARGTLVIDPSGSANARSASLQVVGNDRVVGSATSAAFGGACGHPPGRYTVYFAVAFDRPFDGFGVWSGARLVRGGRRETGSRVGAWLTFDTAAAAGVEAKIGISFVSVSGALDNLAQEATTWSTSTLKARSQAHWEALLDRIRLAGGSTSQQQAFYTALYHALLQPSVFSDADGRFLGEDGRVHVAEGYTQYTNLSEWDIYRGEMQLIALLDPSVASSIVQSLVVDASETGQLPRWLVANTETGLMIGDPSDAIIADAYAFGARRFDTHLALHEMLEGAGAIQHLPTRTSAASARSYLERPGLGDYLSRGYIPVAASTTLEYAIGDFAISQVAGALGDTDAYRAMLARSGNWRETFDAKTGFVEPRLGSGSFPRSVSPTSSTGFVEGDAWQYTFMVPQDMAGLLAAIGPPAVASRRLDSFFGELNAGPNAPHAWLGNEPSLFAPYAYLWLGEPARAEEVVHRAETTLFSPTPNGLPGNDDLGTLSAWYVWNALGLFPVIPGVPGFAVVAPVVPGATITLPSGMTLHISAAGVTPRSSIRSLDLDGRSYDSSWLPFARIAAGGHLDFSLGSTPSSWATSGSDRPPSFGPR
jgi:predicted alpha-1,2-mannosidase